jgi:hypothetical protein
VNKKVNGETRERFGQSAKRNAIVCGEVGKGAIVMNRCMLYVVKKKVEIFYLSSFVENHG